MRTKVSILLLCVIIAGALCCGGCRALGLMLSPSANERKVAAEYPLSEHSKGKLLIFVEGTTSSNSGGQIEDELFQRIAVGCIEKCKFKEKNIISGESINALKSQTSDFSRLSPVEIAKKLGADVVLYVLIEKYELYEVGPEQYYRGSITSRSVLFDANSGDLIWPRAAGGEVVRGVVDLEARNAEIVRTTLLATTEHCILRKLYDSPASLYKTEAEEHNYYLQ